MSANKSDGACTIWKTGVNRVQSPSFTQVLQPPVNKLLLIRWFGIFNLDKHVKQGQRRRPSYVAARANSGKQRRHGLGLGQPSKRSVHLIWWWEVGNTGNTAGNNGERTQMQQQDKSQTEVCLSNCSRKKKWLHAVPSIIQNLQRGLYTINLCSKKKKKGEALGYLSANLLLSRTNMLLTWSLRGQSFFYRRTQSDKLV